jgi:hypothetical protein
MTETKPSKEDIIKVCLSERDMASACVTLGVGRGWLTNKLAEIEADGTFMRRSSCPLLVRRG